MNRLVKGVLFVVLAGGVTAGCSGSNQTASNTAIGASSSASADLCGSMKSLQDSMADLKNAHPVQNGVGTLQPSLTSVQGNVQQVVADAKDQFAPQAQQLQTGFDAVKSAVGTARTAPSAQTLGAVASAIRALGGDVQSFANDMRSTC